MSRRVNSGGVLAVGGWNEDSSAGISQTGESLAGGINTKLRAARRIKISISIYLYLSIYLSIWSAWTFIRVV